jgi:hypothetical protein
METSAPIFTLERVTMKIQKSDVGRFCQVVWDDIGAEDGILIAYDKDDNGYRDCTVFTLTGKIRTVERAMINKLGSYVMAKDNKWKGK